MTKLTLSAKAAAAYCNMSPDTFRAARKRGEGPAVFAAHGGRVRFAKVALDRWMAERADVDPLAPKSIRGAA